MEVGRNSGSATRPSPTSCLAGGYDTAQLDLAAINRAFDAEVKAGRLSYTDASYPIDLHTSDGGGLRCAPLSEGVVPTVPE